MHPRNTGGATATQSSSITKLLTIIASMAGPSLPVLLLHQIAARRQVKCLLTERTPWAAGPQGKNTHRLMQQQYLEYYAHRLRKRPHTHKN